MTDPTRAERTGWRGRAERALPPPGLARRLCLQSALYAVGSGVFLAGNAVFFTRVVGLTPAQVGLGISISGLVAFLVSVPLGKAVDRVGTLRCWLAVTWSPYGWLLIGALVLVAGVATPYAARRAEATQPTPVG